MPTFRAMNNVDLLFAGNYGMVVKNRKLEKLPVDFEELPWFHERTDKREKKPYLEVQDTVILTIQRAGWTDIYEVCCVRGGRQ